MQRVRNLTSSPQSVPAMPVAVRTPLAPGGIKSYYQAKVEAAEITINQKTQNLRRLEAQRNALNARGVLYLFQYTETLAYYILSPTAERGTTIASRAWELCWRSSQSNGKDQGSGESPARREIQCVYINN